MTDTDRCTLAGHEYEPATTCRACAAERAADLDADTAPQRPVAPPAEITEVAERHRAHVARPTATGRSFAQPAELAIPDGFDVSQCGRAHCGAHYVATRDGRAAHQAVFGHPPE